MLPLSVSGYEETEQVRAMIGRIELISDRQRELVAKIAAGPVSNPEWFKSAILEGGRIVQCGMPQNIYSSPANSYVKEFIAHINPLSVLCASDVMVPVKAHPEKTVPAHARIKDILGQVSENDAAIGVIEDDILVGQISKDLIMARLQGPYL